VSDCAGIHISSVEDDVSFLHFLTLVRIGDLVHIFKQLSSFLTHEIDDANGLAVYFSRFINAREIACFKTHLLCIFKLTDALRN